MRDMKVNLSDYLPDTSRSEKRDKELRKACKEFESVFVYQMLKSMRRTVDKCDLFHGGQGEEIYESMLDQEYAKKMAGYGNNSLANILYQQLKGHDISGVGQNEGINGREHIDDSLPRRPLKVSVSSKFGWRKDPFTGKRRFHAGVDLAAREGTQVRASLPGRVLFSDYQHGYGNLVVLDHGHGFTTLYAHNQDNRVNPGDWVEKGSPIATVGSSGRSTGPHLHFEVKRHGKNLDPVDFFGS
ncbi:MAG: peptidoglycan DD-metalloendopeptidase family protein [Deltaproteobacteria bacterium]|nr:peptidoglycan DD-metalloendopeptidase family protein [Deltaproteobacteria bacterium]